jgi:hypothetical protein
MPASTATATALAKVVYEGSLNDQLNSETIGLKRIERTSDGVVSTASAKWVEFPIHTRRNNGVMARNEMEQLAPAGQQGFASGRINLKNLYGRVRLSGQVFELIDTNPRAFASAMDFEMSGLKDDVRKDQSRQFYNDGTGIMCRAQANTTTVNTAYCGHGAVSRSWYAD